ncbi:MAG: alkaline phosphatase family protein [Terriglobia bacterium]
MLRKTVLCSLAAIILLAWSAPLKPAASFASPSRPKLVVVLVIDQFRYDYLMRFRPYFVKGGFNRLLDGGAVFTDCRYDYATTITGPGHATLLTGAYSNIHGIIGNEWYDRELKRKVYCVEDSSTHEVASGGQGGAAPGFSPRNLTASTLGDELRIATNFRAKAVSISLKDRAAVLMGGHTPSAAYWYDTGLGGFVTSTYYMPALPTWVDDFDKQTPAKSYCGQKWQALPETPDANGKVLSEFQPSAGVSCPDAKFLRWLDNTPFMNQIELGFASDAVRSEHLGKGPETDILTVSLSENDYIGHRFGPYSAEVADVTLRTDRYLAKFFDDLDKTVGLDNVWIAFSADHGVAPTPAFIQEHKLGIGLARPAAVRDAAEKALTQAFGAGPWIEAEDEVYLFLSRDTLKARSVAESKAEEVAAEAAASLPDVEAAFTRTQFLTGSLPNSPLARKAANSFNVKRGGDVFLVYAPYAVPSSTFTGTTHGSPWNYDSQVPLIFWGSAFKPGFYATPCQPIDLAATLAARLGLTQPSGAQGTPLASSLR